jgi:hypothetical protein
VKLATLNKSLNKLFQRFLATKYNMSWPKLCCLHTNHSYKHIRKNANYLNKKSWQFFLMSKYFDWFVELGKSRDLYPGPRPDLHSVPSGLFLEVPRSSV